MPIDNIASIIGSLIAVIGLILAVAKYFSDKEKDKIETYKTTIETEIKKRELAKLIAEPDDSPQLNDVSRKETANIARHDNVDDQFRTLHYQLEEWKKMHDKLNELQMTFAQCRNYAENLDNKHSNTSSLNKALTLDDLERFSIGWKPCKLRLDRLRDVIQDLQYIKPAKDRHKPINPKKEMKNLDRLQLELDNALRDSDNYNVADIAGSFSLAVDQFMFNVDKSLVKVAEDINAMMQ